MFFQAVTDLYYIFEERLALENTDSLYIKFKSWTVNCRRFFLLFKTIAFKQKLTKLQSVYDSTNLFSNVQNQ